MAQQTNRVLVLPNVGDARLCSCKSFTFDYYYSVESMRQSAPNTTFITQDYFLQWNQEMKAIKAKKFTTKIVELGRAVDKEYIGSNQLDLKRYRKKGCLLPFDHLEYETNATLDLHITRKTGDQFVIDALQSVQSDVILMNYTAYEFNYSRLKYQPASLTYAEYLIKHAKAAANLLYPYIAVHWRMETADPDKLLKCSQNLVDYIDHIKNKTGITNVYVATDYPIDGGPIHSGTFHKLTKGHHRAANELKSHLNFYTLERIHSSLPLLDNTKFLSNIDINHKDSGIPAILDKLILTYSNWFVSAPPTCCRISSSYTAQVLQGRTTIIKQQNKTFEENTVRDNLLNVGDSGNNQHGHEKHY
ncbi:10010_t:CDS:1 [Paraglomus occultum]|uniref:10010_t:CDS:1 n=1 Tax=Paraglomus occultum TaxID=144539 RepID=A0A9N9D3J1_9GLOM|nr:10010_t:CDS:1 [Paraglomus occultum]